MPNTTKKFSEVYKEAISKAAEQMAKDIDDAVLKAFTSKDKMRSGKAICLKDIEFYNKKTNLSYLFRINNWRV